MMSISQDELLEWGHQHLYPNYRQPPLVLTRGAGSRVWDVSGKAYLDLTGGIAVNLLGHAHPRWVEAVTEQAKKLAHVSNYFFNEPNVALAKKLCAAAGFERAFFCNSGAEAIEASLKLARRHFFDQGDLERHRVIAFQQSFHGRTMGALAATGQAGYRDGFGPLGPVTHVPYGDLAAVERVLGGDVAAVLVEPVQGEGGVRPAPDGFLAGLFALTRRHGCLLLADEIQTGVGRTGRFLAFEHAGVRPDVVALAKGLGGGFPIGAMLCRAELETALPPGSHGSTFGGNPLASAAALAVLGAVEELDLIRRATSLGAYLDDKLAAVIQAMPSVAKATRGLGLLRALELDPSVDIRAALEALRESGLLVTIAGGTALRFSPALTVTEAELDEGTDILHRVLREIT